MNVLTELWWAWLLITLPAVMVLIYQWGETRGKQQNKFRIVEITQWRNMRELRQARQTRMDDQIFNTVEEYRNGVD